MILELVWFKIPQMSPENGVNLVGNRENSSSYDCMIVAPGYESNRHRTGLGLNTRIRLLATALCYDNQKINHIIVGGARIRDMNDTFADLMQQELTGKYKIPGDVIETEYYTFDTASQVAWIKRNRQFLSRVAIITDPEQQNHFLNLIENYDLKDVTLLVDEDIIMRYLSDARHIEHFFKRLHRSPYWMGYKTRERVLSLLTKHIDKQGKMVQMVTKARI